MSQSETTPGKANVKTLAIRLEPELHAQLSVLAQLMRSTITDEIRAAIEAHIANTKASPELSAKASAVLDDIERDAEARRGAIAALFGSEGASAGPSPKATARRTKEAPTSD